MSEHNGVITGFEIPGQWQERVRRCYMIREPGHEIRDFLVERLGIVFIEFENEQELRKRVEQVPEDIKVHTSQPEHA